MKHIQSLLLFIFSCATALYSQTVRIETIPSDASIIVDGKVSWNNPNIINTKNVTSFVICAAEGYVSRVFYPEDLANLEKSHTVILKKNEIPATSFKTRRIQVTKIVDGTGRLSNPYIAGINVEDSKFSNSILKIMQERRFNMVESSTLFEEKTESPEFALGGEIVECEKDTKGSGFQASVVIRWSLYSLYHKKVIYKVPTGGFSNFNHPKGFREELFLAINDALTALLHDPKFLDLVTLKAQTVEASPSSPIELPKVKSTKYATYGDMVKAMPQSVVTVKTNYGHGSGFIISNNGYILTNHHVIQDASSIEIIFENGITLEGTLVRSDPNRDVALLKIPGSGFKPLPLNTNKDLYSIGTEVIAIGTPNDINLGQTVTKGIISGKREFESVDQVKYLYIQTDVSISPGNSGGPMINSSGEVIGIIVSKITTKGVEGIGFAIPINEALNKLNITPN